MLEGDNKREAVVLLSGGIDSATCLAFAINEGYKCRALSFDYGQRHRYELNCAKKIAKSFKVLEHVIFKIDLRRWGGSALTADDIEVPEAGRAGGIPPTYVPARNLIFLSLAAGFAEARGIREIFIGVNSVDYSGYPDCRPEFIESFERTVNLGTKAGAEGRAFKIHAPLQFMNKVEILNLAIKLGVDLKKTSSCYAPLPDGSPCGKCDSCEIRRKAMEKIKKQS